MKKEGLEKKESEKDIKIVINFDEYHPEYDEDSLSLFTNYTLLEPKGWYDKNHSKIQKALDTTNRGRILEILYVLKKTNAFELKKIMGVAYSLIQQYIQKLDSLKLITLKKNISEKGRQEIAIKLHPKVKIIPFSEFIESKEFKDVIKDEKRFTKEAEENFKKEL